ncbi:MAG: Trm112 family protein [Gammaproteobacteria bacterium]|nr:Trm112 family protein [Gammaproteobacteria bacterium]
MDKKILSILACPICKGKVHYQNEQKEIWCKGDGLAFPIRDGIPVMLENEARDLSADEKLSKH